MPEDPGILAGGGEELCECDDDHLSQWHHAWLVHFLACTTIYKVKMHGKVSMACYSFLLHGKPQFSILNANMFAKNYKLLRKW
jgi:hypothetical protein